MCFDALTITGIVVSTIVAVYVFYLQIHCKED